MMIPKMRDFTVARTLPILDTATRVFMTLCMRVPTSGTMNTFTTYSAHNIHASLVHADEEPNCRQEAQSNPAGARAEDVHPQYSTPTPHNNESSRLCGRDLRDEGSFYFGFCSL